MGVRESMNRHPVAWAWLASAVAAVAIIFIIWDMPDLSQVVAANEQAFFSDDDGKTWFADKATNIPPFEHNGKTACRAYLFSCDGGKTRWVGYLEKFTPAAKKQLEQSGHVPPPAKYGTGPPGGRLLKRPGDAEWVNDSDLRRMAALMNLRCPDDSNRPVTPVEP